METASLPAAFLEQQRTRLIAILVSLLAGTALMAGKFFAYWLTGSAAIFSDALESIINVVASAFALMSISLAAKSPDPSHPYGHGKIEYFSAGFEGALIVLAALGIFYQAWSRLFAPQELPNLNVGLLLLLGISLVNLALGAGLVRVGRRTRSLALVADGKHILTDVYTSVGVLAGLTVALFTGWYWLDGVVALLVGLNILHIGARLMHESSAGLMDASDPDLLEEIADILRAHRKELWIDVHRLRARRAGSGVFIDFHLILPRDLPLEAAHREVKELERIFNAHYQGSADILIHLDPCERPVCPICGFSPCMHREEETKEQKLWRPETVTTEAPGENAPPPDSRKNLDHQKTS
ncbi:MAG: cation diffusion facilitator family transporter [Deltaproteobacteria bacterium]|nr:cation diffusion facilitator family transporter [Deltaproteobacteria bacterium]